MYQSMTAEQLEHFAATPTRDKPEHVSHRH
jgi:hypothetical protein